MTRCTGHCCESFSIPLDVLTDPETCYDDDEGNTIRDMLILLDPIEDPMPGCNDWNATCRNFDLVTRSCRIYEDRPDMCSAYPYGRACSYAGCTMTDGTGVVSRPKEENDKQPS